MKLLGITAGCSLLEHKRNESIAKELQITQIVEYLDDYRRNWFQHVNRMQHSRLLKHPSIRTQGKICGLAI